MYPFIKKNIKHKKGLTLLELVISCIVFSLFLFAVYGTLDIGLKSWQLGSTKSDLHQRAEIVLTRIIKDFTYSNSQSLQIENDGNIATTNRYICFETFMDPNNNTCQIETNTFASPLWQGYILYYKYRDPYDTQKSDIYRRFESRETHGLNPSIHPTLLPSITNYIYETSVDNKKVRTVVKDIYDIDFILKGTVLTVNVSFKKHIRSNASVAFSPGGDASKGTELLNMSVSIKSKN